MVSKSVTIRFPTRLQIPDCKWSGNVESKDQMKYLRSTFSHQCHLGFAGNSPGKAGKMMEVWYGPRKLYQLKSGLSGATMSAWCLLLETSF